MVDLRWLRIAAVTEALSLKVLVINLLTVHQPTVSALVGPVHGLAWLATIAVALLVPLPSRVRWTAVVPGVGGLLALRQVARLHIADGLDR